MNYYELMYIIDSSLEQEEISKVKKEVDNFLTSEGSDIYSRSDWGRTRLAYEIEKQNYGHYIVLKFAAKPGLIRQLREKFGLMDAILSHLCVSLDEEPERIAEEEIERKKPVSTYDSTVSKVTKDDEKTGKDDEKTDKEDEKTESEDKKPDENVEIAEKEEKKEEQKTDEVEESA
ncbi:30S ribosomal protein S6 [Candidatus Marinimicrobia bacterium MT.SAG.2]|nr:30S ribosomal protein S6 [Candidatus Marinimicrobia bacterium MT.SAG.2]